MQIEVAAAKVSKYATRESGDTVEMVERPHGGLSFVVVDGQRSGKGAKAISNLAARKAITLLAEGARDGVAARAAHDYLFAARSGQVRADLQILSVDLESRSIVVSRNTDCGALVIQGEEVRWYDQACHPIGLYRNTRPAIDQIPLVAGTGVVLFTDGVRHAGERTGIKVDIEATVTQAWTQAEPPATAQSLADSLLQAAVQADAGYPRDDITVVALLIRENPSESSVRRMQVTFPLA